MFDPILRTGAVCDVHRDLSRSQPAPGEFCMRGRAWRVLEVEAMWREWRLGDRPGEDPTEGVSDLEMWRVRAVVRDRGGRDGTRQGECVVVVLARDLASGDWHVHSIWD